MVDLRKGNSSTTNNEKMEDIKMIDVKKKNTDVKNKNKGADTMIKNENLRGVLENNAMTNETKEEALKSAVQKSDKNKVESKKTQEKITLMTTEGLIDPFDGDMIEEGYFSPVVTNRMIQGARILSLRSMAQITEGHNYSVFAKMFIDEDGYNNIKYCVLFEDSSVAPIDMKQSDLVKMYQYMATKGKEIKDSEMKKEHNSNRVIYNKFRDKVFNLRRGSAIISPEAIIFDTILKLKSLPQDEAITEIEKKRMFVEKLYTEIDKYISLDLQGHLYRGSKDSLYYKLPTDIFGLIANSLKMTPHELAKQLYEMNMLYTYEQKGTGYQTRAKFDLKPNKELYKEMGLDPEKPWKPWVYSVLKIEAFNKTYEKDEEYAVAEADSAFAEDMARMLLGNKDINLVTMNVVEKVEG